MSFDFDRYANSGNYVKFKEVGDSVRGEIISITEGSGFNNEPIPVLEIETDEGERTVSASQVMLRAKLAEVRPEPGDEVTIEFTGLGEAKPGRNAPKLFDVVIHE